MANKRGCNSKAKKLSATTTRVDPRNEVTDMPGFPLADLPLTFLERVVSKLDWKSYFRIQQTCCDMADFIRTNKKPSTRVPKFLTSEWIKNKRKPPHLAVSFFGTEQGFESFCDQLNKYRISCDRLDARDLSFGRRPPSTEQCEELFRLLKPSYLLLDSRGNEIYKSAAAWEKLTKLYIILTLGEVFPALKTVYKFPNITLFTPRSHRGKYFDTEQYCSIFQAILQGQLLPVYFSTVKNMSGFILANLHPIFLDKILSKLDWKSYYRIQQTCRDMAEFVRMHKKTSTSVPKELYVLWLEDKDGSPYLKPDSFPDKSPHNLESLYGVRLTLFGAELETDKDFEGFCAELKKYRVTCELLHVFFFDQPLREIRSPKKEQYVEMYKILKPSRILMDSAETNLYETIPTWKKLKEIDILMTPGEALHALEAISHLSKITLTVQQNSAKTFSAEQFWRVFQATIQFLRSTPLSHLRRFQCDIAYDDNMPMSIEERLHNLTTLSEQTNERFVYNFRVTDLGDSNDFNWFIDESRPVPTFFEVGLTPAGGVILFRT